MRKRRVLHLCACGCGKFCLGCTNAVLALLALFQLILVGCLLWRDTIPLPAPLVRAIASRALPEGLRLEWKTLTSTIGGHLVATDVRLTDAGSGSPVLEIPQLRADLDLVAPLFGGPVPLEEIELTDLALYGAPSSGTGGSDAILRIPWLKAQLHGRNLRIAGLHAVTSTLRMQASGSYFFTPTPTEERKRVSEETTWREHWAEATESLSALENTLRSVDATEAFVRLRLETVPDTREPRLNASFIADRAERSGVDLHEIDLSLSGLDLKTRKLSGTAEARVRRIEWQRSGVAVMSEPPLALKSFRGILTGEANWLRGWSFPTVLSAQTEARYGELPAATVSIALPFENLDRAVHLSGRLGFRSLRSNWSLDLDRASGKATTSVALSGDPDDLLDLPELDLVEVAEAVRFSPHFDLRATAQWGPEFTFERTDFSLRARDFETLENHYDEVRLRGAASPERLVVGPIEAFDPAGQWASGYYAQNLRDKTYRILVNGRIFPHRLDSLLAPFYVKLWEKIDPGNTPVEGDVDVRSRWGDGASTTSLVAVKGSDLAYKGAPVKDLDLWLWQATGFVELMRLHATAPVGALEGQIDLIYPRKNSGKPFGTRLDVTSTLPLETLEVVFGSSVAKVREIVQPSQPPQIALRGEILDFDDGSISQHFTLTASTEAPLTAGGFPLDWLKTSGEIDDQGFSLRPLRFGFAGGETLSDVTLTYGQTEDAPDQIALTAHLQNANYARIHDLIQQRTKTKAETEQTDDTPASVEKVQADSTKLADLPPEKQGTFNLYLEASGPIDRWNQYVGKGQLEIVDAPLGQISLFGGLTRLFSDTFKVPLGAFRLDTLRTDLVLEPGYIGLPSLEVRGPSTRIDSEGRVSLPGGELDIDARVFFLNTENPSLASLFGILLRPLGHAFEVTVRGPLEDPSWVFKRNPLNLLRSDDPKPVEASTPTSAATAESVDLPPKPPEADAPTPPPTSPPIPESDPLPGS